MPFCTMVETPSGVQFAREHAPSGKLRGVTISYAGYTIFFAALRLTLGAPQRALLRRVEVVVQGLALLARE